MEFAGFIDAGGRQKNGGKKIGVSPEECLAGGVHKRSGKKTI
jgi:hypothetical protein